MAAEASIRLIMNRCLNADALPTFLAATKTLSMAVFLNVLNSAWKKKYKQKDE